MTDFLKMGGGNKDKKEDLDKLYEDLKQTILNDEHISSAKKLLKRACKAIYDLSDNMYTMPLDKLISLQFIDDDPFIRGEAERIYKLRKGK